jgi:perosamine synthetase
MPGIPLFKPDFGVEEEKAVLDVVRSGWIAQGSQVKKFEAMIADYLEIGSERVVALSSGTAALHEALLLAGIKAGDEVLVPSMGFIATVEAVMYCNAVPVFVDVDKWLHTAGIEHFEKKLTKKTRAIIPVHIYGRMAPMNELVPWARDNNVSVIEDSAPAFGASLSDKYAGLWGDYGCFSLQSSKPLTTGEGGILIAPSKEYADKARCLSFHGANIWDFTNVNFEDFWEEDFVRIGYNYRMTDLQAAIGIVQLKRFTELTEKKCRVIQEYNRLLSNASDKLFLPPENIEKLPSNTSLQQYVVVLKEGGKRKRDEIITLARKKGIFLMTGGYCIPSHSLWKDYDVKWNENDFPSSLFAKDSIISLPLFSTLTLSEVKEVCDLLLDTI